MSPAPAATSRGGTGLLAAARGDRHRGSNTWCPGLAMGINRLWREPGRLFGLGRLCREPVRFFGLGRGEGDSSEPAGVVLREPDSETRRLAASILAASVSSCASERLFWLNAFVEVRSGTGLSIRAAFAPLYVFEPVTAAGPE